MQDDSAVYESSLDFEEAKRQWREKKLAERRGKELKKANAKRKGAKAVKEENTLLGKRQRGEADSYLVSNVTSLDKEVYRPSDGHFVFSLETPSEEKSTQIFPHSTPEGAAAENVPAESNPVNPADLENQIRLWRARKRRELEEKKLKKQLALKKLQARQAAWRQAKKEELARKKARLAEHTSQKINT